MNRRIALFVVLGLAGCSSMPDTLPPEEAQAAIQTAVDAMAQAKQVESPHVSNVVLGECKRHESRPLMSCPKAQFTLDGAAITTRVVLWSTPNPAHPFRAQFSLTSSSL